MKHKNYINIPILENEYHSLRSMEECQEQEFELHAILEGGKDKRILKVIVVKI